MITNLDVMESISDNTEKDIRMDIKDFIRKTYIGTYTLSNEPNDDGLYEASSYDNIIVKDRNIVFLTGALPFRWSDVKGGFCCDECNELKSLEGAPASVGGDFSCSYCGNLTSLVGAPMSVNGNFWCFECTNLTTLEGAPKSVNGDFMCTDCTNLISLEGAPEKVGNEFDCSRCENLITLKGSPKKVEGFYCDECEKITSLEGAPMEAITFSCIGCGKQFTRSDVRAVCNVKNHIINCRRIL